MTELKRPYRVQNIILTTCTKHENKDETTITAKQNV